MFKSKTFFEDFFFFIAGLFVVTPTSSWPSPSPPPSPIRLPSPLDTASTEKEAEAKPGLGFRV